MFIVERKGTRLRKSFFVWAFLALFGAVGLTMHIHYDPSPDDPKSD
jgi:hypothetical protein